MDILGALLGKKAGGGSPGGAVLKDILGGKRPQPKPQSPARQHPQARRPQTIDDAAKSLEDLLGVSHDHHQRQRETARQSAPRSNQPAPQAAPRRSPSPAPSWSPKEVESMNAQSKILVRGMVNAAKSDGQITQAEQDAILKQLDHVSQEEIEFLRSTFKEKLDVRDFTWSVPLGMEEQVYTVSLIAIDLDDQKEANYLADLAQGLRLASSRCNEIHRSLGAPIIFQS
ncbi:hypothetical protein K227x_60720 [Rubripirellula lacrimiformis]|uniref:Inner membrane protein YebE n=1 Tax=Rubripirellula lacrimiformis TaxID=1930273 RepID=A0A517NKH4_9BACT|nr:DUF533 domain-containing protein [Rubripirellula lacrimiformis]QDT07644.1 hypothetical protein K227x_60720 [Rubripirellula lacrimiformis]